MKHPEYKTDQNDEPQVGLAFVSRAKKLWFGLALGCVLTGNVLGWAFTDCSRNWKGALVLSSLLFGFSLLFSSGASHYLWEKPKSKPLLLGFAIALASPVPLSIAGMIYFRGPSYIEVMVREGCGIQISLGLMYLCGILWGAIVGSWRKKAFGRLAKA